MLVDKEMAHSVLTGLINQTLKEAKQRVNVALLVYELVFKMRNKNKNKRFFKSV